RVLDAELERRQDRVLAVFRGDQLIDGRAEKRAHRVAARTRAREQHRAARVIAARLLVGRRRLRHVEAGDEHDAIADRLERLGDERELEVLALLQRTPVAGRGAVRMPDADEAPRRRGRRQPRGRQRRHHRLEQRQGQRDTGAAQEGPPRNVLLRYVHRLLLTESVPFRRPSRAHGVLGAASVAFTRIWNCALRTTPSTIAENLLWSRAASRAIARTTGMSLESRPRPIA